MQLSFLSPSQIKKEEMEGVRWKSSSCLAQTFSAGICHFLCPPISVALASDWYQAIFIHLHSSLTMPETTPVALYAEVFLLNFQQYFKKSF